MIHKKNVLTIAGSDSSGGAGIQADIKTFEALQVYSASVVSAITAQNTHGVLSIYECTPEVFSAQLDAVLSDIVFDAVKIGMLKSAAQVHIVADFLDRYAIKNIVLDPVMISSSGHPLQDTQATDAICRELMPLITLLTPNIPEAAYLLKTEQEWVCENPQSACQQLLFHYGLNAVLLKGGHSNRSVCEDVLCTKKGSDSASVEFRIFSYRKQAFSNTHGTGCTLSSAIAAYLARGADLPSAIDLAGRYLQIALENSIWQRVGTGAGILNHASGVHIDTDKNSQK